MKYAGSNPPTQSNASGAAAGTNPDSQPAVALDRGARAPAGSAAVHGFDGQAQPNSACPIPVPSDGRARADG